MPIHARLGRSPLIRRAWFIEKLRLDEWYHYRGPSVSLASARVSLRWILFPSLFLSFFPPSSSSSSSFFFFNQTSPRSVFLPSSRFLLTAERTSSNDTFINREDESTPSFLFFFFRGKSNDFESWDYACERGRRREKGHAREEDGRWGGIVGAVIAL